MAKNLIPKIAKMLGVELGEEFKIDTCGDDIFQITEGGIWMRKGIDKETWVEKPFEFVMLCNGDAEIIKLPWKPKKGDTYFSFELLGDTWIVASSIWGGFPNEYALLDKGWIFRTCVEAGAALPAVAEKVGVEYEL